MTRIKKPLFTELDLGMNPIVTGQDFQIRFRELSHKKTYTDVEAGTGKLISSVDTDEVYSVEVEKYTKVFNRSAYRIHIMALPSRARDLYLWLIYEADPGKDYIWINKQRYMEECDVSLNTYKAAVSDLIKSIVIVPSAVTQVYWINPLFFFNGNRLQKFKEKLVNVTSGKDVDEE
jgi:hypothetical protein